MRWRFKRQSMVLVAHSPQQASVVEDSKAQHVQDGAAGADRVVGCCTLVLKVLDAALPAPFPTRQPARLYIGNLVVQDGFRRCGCGSALLQAAEELGVLLQACALPAGCAESQLRRPALLTLECQLQPTRSEWTA